MTRTDLTDQEWERLAPELPSSQGKRGGQYKAHRRVLNGILSVLRTGAPWRDLPERYGKWKTCHDLAFKLIESAQGHWRKINAPHLVRLVREGLLFPDGKAVTSPREEARIAA